MPAQTQSEVETMLFFENVNKCQYAKNMIELNKQTQGKRNLMVAFKFLE